MESKADQMDSLRFATLDVFTQTLYEGNPLAIVIIPSHLKHKITQAKKQAIALEFNLSETLFLHENTAEKQDEWIVDIFTTTEELPFAGHPTIGAACYVLNLLSQLGEGSGNGTLITRAGPIPVSRSGVGVRAEIPHDVHVHKRRISDLQGSVLGLSRHREVRQAEMKAPIVSIVKGMTFSLVELESLEMLGLVQSGSSELDLNRLLDGEGWDVGFVARYYYVVEGEGERLVSGTGGSGMGRDVEVVRIRTRMLELTMEDPATGSAACALGSYLALKEGRSMSFEVIQGVEMGRKSVIGVEVVVEEKGEKVEGVSLSGSAVQVMEGSLRTC